MRYLITIIAIIALSTIGIIALFKPSPKTTADSIIRINKRHITSSELSPLLKKKQLDAQDIDEVINTVITRELLIQEAKKRNIDQEESFRKSLKNYYEQSLIKTLIDRQSQSYTYSPSDKEVETYKKLLRQKADISLQPIPENGVQGSSAAKTEELNVPYGELTAPIRMAILSLQLGEKIRPLCYQEGKYHLLLKGLSDAAPSQSVDITNDEAKEEIISFRRDDYLRDWLEELQKQATITIDKGKI